MKRILTLVLLISLVLSGCAAQADKTQIEKHAVRMINVDGRLYYDSGLFSKHTARCGTMDGDLIKTVAENEIPQSDGQCNFEGAKGYQHTSSITKEVLLDEGWVVFKLFEDGGKDISRFKYCYYIKGRHPNAAADTEIVALSETEDVTFSKTAGRMFSSQFNPNEKQTAIFDYYGNNDKWGIVLTVSNVTPTGITIVCEQFGGTFTGELQTGSFYRVERNDNGEWHEVTETGLCQFVWDEALIIIPENEKTEWQVDWTRRYGNLPKGSYRIAKGITDYSGDFGNEFYYAYFTIE